MIKSASVLIFHPNKILLHRLAQLSEAAGYTTFKTSDDYEAIGIARQTRPDLFLVAPLIPGDLAVAEEVQAKYPWIRVMVLAETSDIAERAKESGLEEVVAQRRAYRRPSGSYEDFQFAS